MRTEALLNIPRLRRRLLNTPRADGGAVLDGRHIYILPTRGGLMFSVVLLVMLIGAINYNNSLAFLLTFLLGGLAVVSMLHTFRNLNRLHMRQHPAEPVFAGQAARLPVFIHETVRTPRYGIVLRLAGQEQARLDIAPGQRLECRLRLHAHRRGWLQPGRLRIDTEYPLGLFHAWSWLALTRPVLVYPEPVHARPLPMPQGGIPGEGRPHGGGEEDFSGLRPYRPGDSPRRVAWKTAAREQAPMFKQFDSPLQRNLWLEWSALKGLDDEARLSQLCAWVLEAEAAGANYGLRLPEREIKPDHGPDHQRACLRHLALHPPIPAAGKRAPGRWRRLWRRLTRKGRQPT